MNQEELTKKSLDTTYEYLTKASDFLNEGENRLSMAIGKLQAIEADFGTTKYSQTAKDLDAAYQKVNSAITATEEEIAKFLSVKKEASVSESDVEDLVFASEEDALQHLSNIVGMTIKVAGKGFERFKETGINSWGLLKYMTPEAKELDWMKTYIDKMNKLEIEPPTKKELDLIDEGGFGDEDLSQTNVDLLNHGKKMSDLGWKRFEYYGTWDVPVESGAGGLSKEEEKKIIELGYYGREINDETIKGLEEGKPYETGFELQITAQDGTSTKKFETKKELIDFAKGYPMAAQQGKSAWATDDGQQIIVDGATVKEIFG
jgi:hypothetical protein